MLRATLCALLIVVATPLGAQEQKRWQVPGPVQTEVALALVLAVDASGSVSDDRFELQKQGYAAAFRNRQVLNSIRSLMAQSIAVTMMQWTGPELHVQTVDWTLVKDEVTVNALADAIEASKRQLFGGRHLHQWRDRLFAASSRRQPVSRLPSRHRYLGRWC
jgi:hypothetical protein